MVLENTDELQVQRTSDQTSQTAEHVAKWRNAESWCWGKPETNHGVVNCHKKPLKKKHRRNHSQRASGERIREGTTSKEPVVRIRDGTTANEPEARRMK